jgi:FkbM family methyltransferase
VTLSDTLLRIAPYATVRAYEFALSVRGDPLLSIIEKHVGTGDVAVDIGAHRGWYTRRLAGRTGRSGRVHAIEPNPAGVQVLSAVARRHPNVRIHQLAASDSKGVGLLRRPYFRGERTDAMGSLSNPVLANVPHDTVEVKLARLDDELSEERGRIAFVKCDVEGHEHAALLGAGGIIARDRPVILVEIEQRHRDRPLHETVDWIISHGYEGFFVARSGIRPLAEFDVQRDQLRYLGSELKRGRPDPAYVSDFLFTPTGTE